MKKGEKEEQKKGTIKIWDRREIGGDYKMPNLNNKK
jgi:hypothetical protein